MTNDAERSPIPALIASAYDLREFVVLRQFESYGNQNWLLEDARRRRYVLRRQRLNAEAKRIEFQLALQQHLSRNGLPVPAVIETASRQLFATDDAGVPWMLSSYIDGDEFEFQRRPQVIAAAQALAQFHQVSESFVFDASGPEHKVSLRECWTDPLRDLGDLEAMADASVANELSEIREWWREILRVWPVERLDQLPSGWIHGDFHGRNLVFDGDRLAGLFDFDDVDRGPYSYDVAAGMYKFGRTSRSSLTLRTEFARAFLDGYESVRHLTTEERAILPILMPMGYPPHPRHYAWWREQHGEDLPQFIREEMGTMRALRAEVARVGPALFAE